MLTILHGTDIVASRKFFIENKNAHPEAVSLDAENVNMTDLAQVIEGGGLFGESKYIFIEQFLTKRKKSGDYKDIIAYLDSHAADHTIFLWENKELDIGTQKAFQRAAIRPFKLPQTLFAMMDNIRPGNGKQLVLQFHQTIEDTEVEMVFFMIIRQFRLLLAVHPESSLRGGTTKQSRAVTETGRDRHAVAHDDGSTIEELKRMTWQRGKIQQQAASFGKEGLLELYNKLFEIERQQKTGTLPAPLPTIIDFFLLEI